MITSDETGTAQRSVLGIGGEAEPVAALLVAYAPKNAARGYQFEIKRTVVAGRDEGCDIEILNKEVSRRHFRIFESAT
jgi:pSer/pThr/pTyr-binding forkhead associated (FHA) protein